MQAHYDPEIWDDPESFNPERNFDANGKFQTSKINTYILDQVRKIDLNV